MTCFICFIAHIVTQDELGAYVLVRSVVSHTNANVCSQGRAGLPRNCVAIWYLLLNYLNGQIKLRVWAWSETRLGLKEGLSLNMQEEEPRTGDQAALGAEPGTLSRDMGAGEEGVRAPCWPGAGHVTVCLHSPDGPL